ncbi:hypothetical protein G647_04685 [Cladophialophora carrionii CBS 160.54]|uniref:RGS domain-containing protein n=1 Tax=Cladophialophora carrionii CBS 160.54 TaxID=1279043 RepID=V9D8C2_9EURO|nr:uncharacterized protein G647_04685 [Cladophialophora carrionii CBS 160.54]ETI22891.1 hypothetical protein G647_04685 [Cladophialophora carrionii CBS 160.54]
MGLNPNGRNWGSLVNWDDLGKFYAGFIVAWTVILYAGVAFLIVNRNLAFIKIRNQPLAVAAVSFLHVYLVKIFLAYTTNGHFLCSAEFWIMSIYLPFGIALFQANLAQLRSISDQQRDLVYTKHGSFDGQSSLSAAQRVRYRWSSLSGIQKSYVYVGTGMTVQLIITAALYATTPTLQGDWSSYGDVSHAKGQALCRKSPEWIPSAFWQLAWSWLYGPYLLFRVRNIHDVHYWRLQVIYSVISGLPGAPLWLAALYSTAFKPVNRRWVPPMWLAPGIVVMQFTTIFFPIYEIIKSRLQLRQTLAILESWEDRRGIRQSSNHADSSRASSDQPSITSSQQRELYTMASLERALADNPNPLLKFAATRDFTAENILFLMQVQRWKETYASALRANNTLSESAKSQLFHSAVDIYMSRVNDKTTDFPINIESRVRQDLDTIFGPAVPTGRLDPDEDMSYYEAESWIKSPKTTSTFHMDNSAHSGASVETLTAIQVLMSFPVENHESIFPPHPGVAPLGESRAKMRAGFDEHVFDAAQRSIKYLVLTNTWQKFVKEQQPSIDIRIAD